MPVSLICVVLLVAATSVFSYDINLLDRTGAKANKALRKDNKAEKIELLKSVLDELVALEVDKESKRPETAVLGKTEMSAADFCFSRAVITQLLFDVVECFSSKRGSNAGGLHPSDEDKLFTCVEDIFDKLTKTVTIGDSCENKLAISEPIVKFSYCFVKSDYSKRFGNELWKSIFKRDTSTMDRLTACAATFTEDLQQILANENEGSHAIIPKFDFCLSAIEITVLIEGVNKCFSSTAGSSIEQGCTNEDTALANCVQIVLMQLYKPAPETCEELNISEPMYDLSMCMSTIPDEIKRAGFGLWRSIIKQQDTTRLNMMKTCFAVFIEELQGLPGVN